MTKTDDEIRKSHKEKVDIREGKADIEGGKVDIRGGKADIGGEKVDIEFVLEEKAKEFSSRTASHIRKLFDVFGYEEIFGRREIVALLKLQNSSASKLLSKLVHSGVIEPVSGCGKGRLFFSVLCFLLYKYIYEQMILEYVTKRNDRNYAHLTKMNGIRTKGFTYFTTCVIYKLTCTTSKNKWYNKNEKEEKNEETKEADRVGGYSGLSGGVTDRMRYGRR